MKKIWHVAILALLYSSPIAWLVLDNNLNAQSARNNAIVAGCGVTGRTSTCATNAVNGISIGGGLILTLSENFLD